MWEQSKKNNPDPQKLVAPPSHDSNMHMCVFIEVWGVGGGGGG